MSCAASHPDPLAAGGQKGRGRDLAPSCWLITDGKIGDEIPARGVAEAMRLAPAGKTVAPRPVFAAVAPWGPPDPRDVRTLLQPPFPKLAFAAGRRSVSILRALKRTSPDTFAVFFGNPRTRRHGADVLWAPAHDGLAGAGVVVTGTAPHTRSADALAQARMAPHSGVAALSAPRAAILIGGPSRHHTFSSADADALLSTLAKIRAAGFSIAVTASRRTPDALRSRLHEVFRNDAAAFIWDGSGDNPYTTMLALCDAVLVTADSTNMVGEALASGAPVHVFQTESRGRRHPAFLDALVSNGLVRMWAGSLSTARQAPVDATPIVAAAIAARFAAFQQARNADSSPPRPPLT